MNSPADRDDRPTPEQMLARAREDAPAHDASPDAPPPRGKLRIYFGYAPGVGKTYAMLRGAHELRREGIDVVVGYVEPHARPETAALTEGLDAIPPREAVHRGLKLREFDLEAALVRRPERLLVDELAHTNAVGSRHAKRWQDVRELLDAGIDVDTTLNVQHVESLHDVVGRITGANVRETVPDTVLFEADRIELIDLAPEELMERLQEGKVYIAPQAAQALRNFFRKANLTALRELALRRTADRVHADVQAARQGTAPDRIWPTREQLLVCVGPAPSSARVVRSAKRLADSLRCEWLAVHVEPAGEVPLTPHAQARLARHLRLAEELGAETATVSGDDPVAEVLRFARSRNVTQIVIGKSETPRRWWRRRTTIVDRLLAESGDIDIHIVPGLPTEPVPAEPPAPPDADGETSRTLLWGLGPLLPAVLLALMSDGWGFSEGNEVMIFLLGVTLAALRGGRAAGIVASVGGVVLFDLLFVEPYYTFHVDDRQYLVTFGVMLTVSLVIGTLTANLRRQGETASRNRLRAEVLYRATRALATAEGTGELAREAERAAVELFRAEAALWLPDERGKLQPTVDPGAAFAADDSETAVAQWVSERNRPAGRGTDTLPGARATYFPLQWGGRTLGAIGLRGLEGDPGRMPEQRQLLESFLQQTAHALDRCRLVETARRSELDAEKERLRSTLLSSVSHDLRTPLAVICGAAAGLLEARREPTPETRRELLETIRDEAERLRRLVENLLTITRLEAGGIELRPEWTPFEEVVGSALRHVRAQLGKRPVTVQLGPDLPSARLDPLLIEQVFVNLLENAAKFSADAAPIEIAVEAKPHAWIVETRDRGTGIVPGDEDRIFEKFHRGRTGGGGTVGAGLGLAICKAIVTAHGGRIHAANRPDGGACFRFTLPRSGEPPPLPPEPE